MCLVLTERRRDPTNTTTARREERCQKTRYARARCATVNTGPSAESEPRFGVREPAQLQLVPAGGSAATRWNRGNYSNGRWGEHGSTKNRPLAPPPLVPAEPEDPPRHGTRYHLSFSIPRSLFRCTLSIALRRPLWLHAAAPESRICARELRLGTQWRRLLRARFRRTNAFEFLPLGHRVLGRFVMSQGELNVSGLANHCSSQ